MLNIFYMYNTIYKIITKYESLTLQNNFSALLLFIN